MKTPNSNIQAPENRGKLHNEIIEAVRRGASDREIAAVYGISERTVRAVRENNKVKQPTEHV